MELVQGSGCCRTAAAAAAAAAVASKGAGCEEGKGAGEASLGGGAGCYRPKEPLKRYWERELWSCLFHDLLNPTCPNSAHSTAGLTLGLPESMLASQNRLLASRDHVLAHLSSLRGARDTVHRLMNKQHIMMYDFVKKR